VTACFVLEGVKVLWAGDVLAPLLDDRLDSGETYLAGPGKGDPRLPLRICDAAAAALARHDKELSFTLAGGHVDLDKQIAAIREQLGRKK
jgi:hypothetical protein